MPQHKKQRGMHNQGYGKAYKLVPFPMAAVRPRHIPVLKLGKAWALRGHNCRLGRIPPQVVFGICDFWQDAIRNGAIGFSNRSSRPCLA